MTNTLLVLMGDLVAGTLTRSRGLLRFEYDPAYAQETATPLSLSMPLRVPVHGDKVVAPWLWNLLPEDPAVLRRWATTFDVSPTSAFSLVSSPVGEDCAGAIGFVTPERLDEVRETAGTVEWLDEPSIARRLRELRTDAAAWLGADSSGRFSLAGAQAKTALLHRDGRWGVPSGRIATSHILKPAITGLDDHDLNEHLCLQAARACGLPAAASDVVTFEDQQAVVVERYDRRTGPDGHLVRLHQEDACQALGLPPERKYQSEGGPSSTDIVRLLRGAINPGAETDVDRFIDAMIFNWLVAGTDAHGKNFSLLLSGPRIRLAPLYDLASALPYPGMHPRKLRYAMKFAGSYLVTAQGVGTWRKLAVELETDLDRVVARARRLTDMVPDALADTARTPKIHALGSSMPDRLTDAVARRATECARSLS